jgi:hypothetical protein
MKKLLLSGLVFGAMSSAALAAEPLTEQQMDAVTAGAVEVLGPYLHVTSTATIDPLGGVTATGTSETFFVVTGSSGS